jgi:signal transduction histidine kinase
MTLLKNKNCLEALDQSLLKLPVSNITPDKPTPNPSTNNKDTLPLIDAHLVSNIADLLDCTAYPSPRIAADEEEKRRISRELHDGLGQLLTSMKLHIQKCLDGCDDQGLEHGLPEAHKESLQALSSMVKQAMNEVRTICSAIRPAILDDLGVLAAISWQCRQISQLCSKFDVRSEFGLDESDIPEEIKTVIYRIVQESLNNAMKYSNANLVKVNLFRTHNSINLTVRDDGVGFDPAVIKDKLGVGLMSMRERAESVNGTLQVNTMVNQGVEVCASFPLKRVALNG